MTKPTALLLDYRSPNALWGSLLAETLARRGLTQAVISPGSRSTPLTLAFTRHPRIECVPVLDERSAAFFALGLARRTRRAVALVCTSGTAGANYHPAVIEAQAAGVPLLVLTADRPPEMRGCRSGQTIDQQKLFGGHVNFYHELAVPAADALRLRYLRQAVAHAWDRTQWPVPGPVHLNAPFRDPLAPAGDAADPALARLVDEQTFFAGPEEDRRAGTRVDAAALAKTLRARTGDRGIIVAGPAQPEDPAAYSRAVARVASRLGWPVLADALSPLRHHAGTVRNLVTSYDLIARSEALTRELRPDRVLCLDEWPTSKALRQWLERVDPPVTLLTPQLENPDALHLRGTVVHGSIERLDGDLPRKAAARGWLGRWLGPDRRLRRQASVALARTDWLFEGAISAQLPGALSAGTAVMLANSMPVRDAEYFWPPNSRAHAIYFNRGANGIDGTLSTALGLAHGGAPVVLLTGDLALLHDVGGFRLARRLRGSVTVVLVNNNGGGIFEHLPVARHDPPFEDFFATPQDADFAGLCAAHAVPHARVRGWAQLRRLLAARPRRGLRVLEVRTDRKRDAAFRQELFRRLADGA